MGNRLFKSLAVAGILILAVASLARSWQMRRNLEEASRKTEAMIGEFEEYERLSKRELDSVTVALERAAGAMAEMQAALEKCLSQK
jgi:hypothetical protein